MPYRAICFVIMPFGREAGRRGPRDRFDPRLQGISSSQRSAMSGFDPVRADEEVNAGLIHKAMFERLVLSKYAIADLTIFNPNVYYELRRAPRRSPADDGAAVRRGEPPALRRR